METKLDVTFDRRADFDAAARKERLREHADILYGALLSREGRPARYQLERIETLERELADVEKEVDALVGEPHRADDSQPVPRIQPSGAAGADYNGDDFTTF